MGCTVFRIGLYSSEKVVRHIHSKIMKRRSRGGEVAVEYDACETPIHATTR